MNLATIGFDLAIETVERLVLAQEELAPALRDLGVKVRWIQAQELRVSLQVLGRVQESFLFDVADTLGAVAGALVPFKVSLVGIRAEPAEAPRLLIAQVELGSDLVIGLQKVLTLRLERLGVRVDALEFKPWVFVGRLQGSDLPVELADTLAPFVDLDFGSSLVTSVVLLERGLGRRTAKPSNVLRRFPLGKT